MNAEQHRIAQLTFVSRFALRVADTITRALKEGLTLSHDDPIAIDVRAFQQVSAPMFETNAQTPEEHYQELYRACIAEMIEKPEKTKMLTELLQYELATLIKDDAQ